MQPDGKIVVGGSFNYASGGGVARLNSNGTWDNTSFGNSNILTLRPQADGSFYAGGFGLKRFTAQDILDPDFNVGTGANSRIEAMQVQTGGKLLIGGQFTSYNGTPVNRIARVNTNGSFDSTFDVGSGASGSIFSLALEPDGKLLVGGQFLDFNNSERLGIVRLQTTGGIPHTLFDYDGDGRADLSVRRPSDGIWHLLRATAGYTAMQYGVEGDRMAPADYDGDGKTDVAMFRPSNGTWYIYMSQSQTFQTFVWGEVGDLPVPTDRDADGRTDLVVYRESDNIWYTRFANGTFAQTHFGVAGDKPVVGDFDADGKGDIAVYRPSNNNWYIIKSSIGFFIQTWGEAGDVPITGDFDGDGATDQAVFRPSTGQWWLSQTTAGFASRTWGVAGDIPVAADYDGDGKTDVAVFRPSTGEWYIVNSTAGILVQHFGQDGDIPTQSAFNY